MPESFSSYYPEGCSWLMHRVMEVTNTLGPITKHYRPPTTEDAARYYNIKDAAGYYEGYEEVHAKGDM